MADLIDKAAAVQVVFDWEQGKISGTLADAIAALPAQGVKGCETGYFATAAIDFIHEMEARGFRCAAGQSDDDDLDFSIGIYRGKEVIGCVSFHADRTWSCFMELDGKTFRENAISWGGWPDGFLAAFSPAEAGGVEANAAERAVYDRTGLPPVVVADRANTAPRDDLRLTLTAPAPDAVDAIKDALTSLDMARDKLTAALGVSEGHVTPATDAVEALVKAAVALHADMLERARTHIDAMHGDQYRIVNAGRTAWHDFDAALAAIREGRG